MEALLYGGLQWRTSTEEINTKTGRWTDTHTDGQTGGEVMGRQQTKNGICAAAFKKKTQI